MSSLDPSFYPLAVKVTRQLRPAHAADFDDLVQEGVIAAWQASTSAPRRDPGTYGRVAGKRRIATVMSGRSPMTGAASDGRSYEPLRRADRVAPLSERPDVPAVGPDPLLCAEVRRAVRELPHEEDRRAVHLEFWLGYSRAETARHLGISPRALSGRWTNRIAPALREALMHLADPELGK